jgi:chemotaxis protein methyltransferase CheR
MTISDPEFERLRKMFHRASGIQLADSKKVLVCGRLAKRLRHHRFPAFRQYLDYIEGPEGRDERQVAIDLLTTNETHFFREPKHFEHFRRVIESPGSGLNRASLQVWSAACSSGEEPYSIAMLLSELLPARTWRILASDLSTKVLAETRAALYGKARADEIPRDLRRKYCLEGTEEYEGMVLMDRRLRERVETRQLNLMEPLPGIGPFDVVFLRNVLIYFDVPAKKRIVENVASRMKPGAILYIGHSETLGGVTDCVSQELPTIYRKP